MKNILIVSAALLLSAGAAVAHDCNCKSFDDHTVVVMDNLPHEHDMARRAILAIDLDHGDFTKADDYARRSDKHEHLLIQQVHDLAALGRITPDEAEAILTHFAQHPVLRMVRSEPQTHRFGRVHANDGLIDLTRINLASTEFAWANFRGEHSDQVDMKPHFRRGSEVRTSENWMSKGLPSVGPDGKPVQICRIVRSQNATYFELSYSEAFEVLHATQWPAGFDEACLPAAATSDYWQQRVKGLVNERY